MVLAGNGLIGLMPEIGGEIHADFFPRSCHELAFRFLRYVTRRAETKVFGRHRKEEIKNDESMRDVRFSSLPRR
jgi:hypothetical protein